MQSCWSQTAKRWRLWRGCLGPLDIGRPPPLAQRIQPFFLPAYAPGPNLLERLWRYLNDKLACHRWWNDLDRLQ